jgi:hypothetical protein
VRWVRDFFPLGGRPMVTVKEKRRTGNRHYVSEGDWSLIGSLTGDVRKSFLAQISLSNCTCEPTPALL